MGPFSAPSAARAAPGPNEEQKKPTTERRHEGKAACRCDDLAAPASRLLAMRSPGRPGAGVQAVQRRAQRQPEETGPVVRIGHQCPGPALQPQLGMDRGPILRVLLLRGRKGIRRDSLLRGRGHHGDGCLGGKAQQTPAESGTAQRISSHGPGLSSGS